MAEDIRVTAGGVYVKTEADTDAVRVTAGGVYVKTEADNQIIRVATGGVYVKLTVAFAAWEVYAVGLGHDVAANNLDAVTPQPRSPGVLFTRRFPSGNYGVLDDAPYCPLTWSALPNGTDWPAIQAQFGIDGATKIAPVTIVARDEWWEWRRYNGYAQQAAIGDDGEWRSFYADEMTINVIELVELEG